MLLVFATILDLITTATFLQYPLQLLTLKKDKPIYKIIMGMFFVFTMIISFLSRTNEEFNANPFKPIVLFGVIAVTFFTCFSDKISQKTIAYVLFIASMCITELSVMALFTFMGFSLRDDKVANVLSNVVAILVLWILLLICKKIFDKNLKHKNYSSRMWQFDIIIVSQLMCSSAIAISVYNNNNFELTSANIILWIFVIATIICMVICDIALYKVLLVNSENHDLKEALELSNLKNELGLEYYNKIRKFCDNELVNIIMINKYDTIKANHIEFSSNLNVPNNINVKNTDLCRLFTNIIDNAIESCVSSNDKGKVFIILSSQIKDNNFVVKCINYCDHNITDNIDNLQSTKPNHKGLGIEILKNITESYSGDFTVSCEDNTFTTIALLKI